MRHLSDEYFAINYLILRYSLMIRTICLLSLILFLAGCKNDFKTVTERNEFGQEVTYQIHKETGLKEGPYALRDSAGVLLEEASYLQDTLHGERKLYTSKGVLETIENYKEGSFEGPYQLFYSNGQVKFVAEYHGGVLEGAAKGYYENGQIKEDVTFKDNVENGPFIEYHPNGNLKAKGSYYSGNHSEHGPLELFDENGDLIKKMNCEIGVCRTSWTRTDGDVSNKKI